MSIPLPLTVKLATNRREMFITDLIGDLTFSSIDPGGYSTATVELHKPLRMLPSELRPFAKVYVYDRRSAQTVWEGRVEDLGRTAGQDGEVYSLGCVGPMAHAKDKIQAVVYADQDPNSWIKYVDVTQATLEVDESDNLDPGLIQRFPASVVIASGKKTSALYKRLTYTGQHIARVAADHDGYATTANLGFAVAVQADGGANFTVPLTATLSTVTARSVGVIGTHWSANVSEALLEFYNPTGGGVTTSASPLDSWVTWRNIAVRATLYDRNGNELTTAGSYTTDTVLASDIVADLLGRMLDQYDGANAQIDTTAYTIEQLAYWDGATADQMLADLMQLEPGYTWHAWETNPTTGKYRFEWVARPTTVRYQAGIQDGCDMPSTSSEVYNVAVTRYRGGHGFARTSTQNQAVPDLTAAGITRVHFEDQGDNIGTKANADRAGQQFLADHAAPVNAGRLTIARPILDYTAGRMVMPWEIRPGELIRVTGLPAYPDALNRTNRDGYTVFTIKSVEFNTGSASATLELDQYSNTVALALARIAKSRAFQHRRR